MISQSGKKILEKFVSSAKNLLMQNITELLQQYYGIWIDGHSIPVEQLSNQDPDIVHTAKMLRERLKHLLAALPENQNDKERLAVGQLIAEQAFTQLNRFSALRMCEERGLILESIHGGYDSVGFQSFDAISQVIGMPQYDRYKWYLHSIFDELSIELPAVFDRFSPYGLIFPDESTLLKLLELINSTDLSEWYDEQNGTTVNFWKEDETLGWMFQDYNSLEERRKMREESNKPRNSREMAVRNQFFTPEYIVRFLTDNSLGRIWYEMTKGQSLIGEKQCSYMVKKPDETLTERTIKEPTEILSLDPTCGSMHFGLYLYEVYEFIYMDAWDNHPNLLIPFREIHTRDTFHREVPRLILENNIYGCEIDPRALQIAALSLWLRAQRSYGEMGILPQDRPLIKKSNLVLAEAMPGNKKLLKGLMEELDKPMQNLIKKIWDKMQFVGEAGLLFKMEKEIEDEIDYLKNNWTKVNQYRYATLFSSNEEKAKIEMENEARRILKENKEEFFKEITSRLKEALYQLSSKLSEEEGYENALFSDDATRGFAFIELCQKRFDCIVMNPPFGEGSENTSSYLDAYYPAWCRNLVCAFFDRMQEMLTQDFERYTELVSENDDLWMDLADIDRNSEFRQTLNNYKQRRPYEELLSIDNACYGNVIDKNVMAQEIIQELVGIAFGRWDIRFAQHLKEIPAFGGVFDALPFMPTVSLDNIPSDYLVDTPADGILSNQTDSRLNLAMKVRDVMHLIWREKADDMEYELCRLIGVKSLQAYFETPQGFFDYHFKRYTKSRRKAPIYWPLSSEDGSLTYWIYYPKLSHNTLPSLIIKLREENEKLMSGINAAMASKEKNLENDLRAKQYQVENMMVEINRIIDSGYEPNHDDGVPVTSCPLVNLISHRAWKAECQSNLEELNKGNYDWSHLAMSMYPARVTKKAKKDWCMALTHGLEHLCENKPKEKKPRKKKEENSNSKLLFD